MADATRFQVMSKQIDEQRQATEVITTQIEKLTQSQAQIDELIQSHQRMEAMMAALMSQRSNQLSRPPDPPYSAFGDLTSYSQAPQPPDPPDCKSEFPKFDGTLLHDWFRRCDQYFHLHKTPPEMRVRIASPHMIGKALQWHTSYIRNNFGMFPPWPDYTIAISAEFGDNDALLMHQSSLSPYHNQNNQSHYKIPNTTSLLPPLETTKVLPYKPNFHTEINMEMSPRKLSHEEMQESGMRRLCMSSDGSFHLESKKSQIFVMECEDATMSGGETNVETKSLLEKETIPSSVLCDQVPATQSQENNMIQQEELVHDTETIMEMGPIQEPEPLGLAQCQVPIPSLEPSRRCQKESLAVINDLSCDLGCVIGKPNGCICDSEFGQANFHDEEEFKGLNLGKLLKNERLFSIICLLGLNDMSCWTQLLRQQIFPKSWRFKFKTGSSGEAILLNTYRAVCLGVQDQWDWISEVHSGGGVMKITQWLLGMLLQGLINMDKKLQKVLLDDVLRVVVCWSVHSRTFEAEWEIYLSANQTSRNQELLIIHCLLMIGEFSRSKGLNETCCFLLEVYFDKFVGCKAHGNETQSTNQSHGMEGSKRDIQGLESGHKRIVLKLKLPLSSGADWEQPIRWVDVHFSDNQSQEKGLLSFPWELMLANLKENHACGDVKFHLKHKWRSRLLQTFLRQEVFVENDVLFTSPDKMLFSNNHKLLHPETGFCTQFNDLELLNTEHQTSPGLDYFTYLNFIWKQVLNCGCEASHVSSRIFSIGGVHGLEAQRMRLLVLNEISLLENYIKVDFTIEENWFYTKPIIREVFHLQRPPELIDLQGNPNFITKVLVQWKEHPPDQFFSSFYWQVLMLSSLRTRMFSTGEYCYRMISIIRFSYAFIMVCWYNFYLGTINRSVLVRLRLCKACCHFQKT